MQDPPIIQPRGRLQGPETRRQQAFEASTLREPSLFERVKAETAGGDVPTEIHNAVD